MVITRATVNHFLMMFVQMNGSHHRNEQHSILVITFFRFAGDSTDSLFSVVNSGENAGQVSVTGNIDRETDTTHTMNVRVSVQKLN